MQKCKYCGKNSHSCICKRCYHEWHESAQELGDGAHVEKENDDEKENDSNE